MPTINPPPGQAVLAPVHKSSQARPVQAWRGGAWRGETRDVPEETAIAVVHDGTTYAVMMATPGDVEDFALGFSLTEGVIASPGDVRRLEIVETDLGVEARMWLEPGRGAALAGRRRRLAGPTGCGLCGIDSLAEASRPLGAVAQGGMRLGPADIIAAMASLESGQALNARTHAVHAAAFWTPVDGLIALREDVGRHNALDKLAGALGQTGRDGTGGAVLLTSRVSVEMVQKAAAIRAPVLAAVSAPTTLAVATARAAGITLVAVARADGFEVFTHPERIAA